MPGEIECDKRKDRNANGIEMSCSVYDELKALADKYNVGFDIQK